MNKESNNVYYVYGFTPAGLVAEDAAAAPTENGLPAPPRQADLSPSPLNGGIVEQHPPFFWRYGEVAVVLSLVSQAEFCGPAGEKNLADLEWLAPRAHQHQAVLEQVMHRGSVWPARFGTLFSSLSSLGDFLKKHEVAIAPFLERVNRQEEWAVKGFLNQERAEAELSVRLRAPLDLSPVSPGLAYIQEQRLRSKVKQELENQLAVGCNGLLNELNPLASEVCQRRMLSRETTGAEGEMVVNWAFLLPPPAVDDFRAQIARANDEENLRGLSFELSGPWPPYSFCPALEAEPEPTVTRAEGDKE